MNKSSNTAVHYGTPNKRAATRSKAGRRCEYPGCVTVLSTYNASPTCWLHTNALPRHPLAPAANPLT